MTDHEPAAAIRILTIGHSTRAITEFIRLLAAHHVRRVIDVRTIPRSRHNPQFNRTELSPVLRRARPDSINTGWRNASFRGYADYMQSKLFRTHLDRCIELARRERVVLMCAEAVPWRCHRSLIADALLARGIPTGEITSGVRVTPHVMTAWARVRGTRVTYPGHAEGTDSTSS